jgi:hypothetical protein
MSTFEGDNVDDSCTLYGASHDQADPRDGKKLTFQAIHLHFFVIDIVSISHGKPKTGFGIS